MATNILYTSSSEPNQTADLALHRDMMDRHRTVPFALRGAFLIAMADTSQWLLGNMTFDEFIDKLGALADKLKEADETRQFVSSN